MYLCQSYRVTCVFRKLGGGELRTLQAYSPEATYAIWYRRGRKPHNHGTTAFVPITHGALMFRNEVTFECTASKSVNKRTCEPKPLRLTILQRRVEEAESLIPVGTEMCVDLAKYMTQESFQREYWFPYFISEEATCQLYILIHVEPRGAVINIREVVDSDTTVGSVGSDEEDGVCQGDVVRTESPAFSVDDSMKRTLADTRRASRERQRNIELLELENGDLRMKLERAGLQVNVEKKRAKIMTMRAGALAQTTPGGNSNDTCMCAIS